MYGSLDKDVEYVGGCRDLIAADGLDANVTLAGLGMCCVLPVSATFSRELLSPLISLLCTFRRYCLVILVSSFSFILFLSPCRCGANGAPKGLGLCQLVSVRRSPARSRYVSSFHVYRRATVLTQRHAGEAGLAGLPVVCTDVGASREVVSEGDTVFGRCVPPRNAVALGRAILEVLLNTSHLPCFLCC